MNILHYQDVVANQLLNLTTSIRNECKTKLHDLKTGNLSGQALVDSTGNNPFNAFKVKFANNKYEICYIKCGNALMIYSINKRIDVICSQLNI